MEYINLTITQLADPAYKRSTHQDRSVWMTLLSYCVQQENGGRIPKAQSWTEWDFQQVVGLPATYLDGVHYLWSYRDGDLIVEFYPLDKQKEVQAKRRAGKRGGLSSGEARTERPASTASSSASRTAATEREGKEKGKENGKEGEVLPAPPPTSTPSISPTLPEVEAYFVERGSSVFEAQKFFDHYEANGWKQGGRTRIKSWHASARSWIRRSGGDAAGGFGAKNSGGGGAASFNPETPNAHTGGLEVFN